MALQCTSVAQPTLAVTVDKGLTKSEVSRICTKGHSGNCSVDHLTNIRRRSGIGSKIGATGQQLSTTAGSAMLLPAQPSRTFEPEAVVFTSAP